MGLCLEAVTGALGAWALLWPIPTQVSGTGVLIYPDNAGILDARAGGQVRDIQVKVGDTVRRGQVLMRLYLPVLERHNPQLVDRDAVRLDTERRSLETSLAKFANDRQRYGQLQDTYASKLRNLDWRARREVVAPLSSEVVGAEQSLTVQTFAYVEWRSPLSYVIPGLRSLTGGYRTTRIDRRWDRPALRQPGTLP